MNHIVLCCNVELCRQWKEEGSEDLIGRHRKRRELDILEECGGQDGNEGAGCRFRMASADSSGGEGVVEKGLSVGSTQMRYMSGKLSARQILHNRELKSESGLRDWPMEFDKEQRRLICLVWISSIQKLIKGTIWSEDKLSALTSTKQPYPVRANLYVDNGG